ncbi:hypothetical protein G6O69_34850 [Pseudenhygromyxa sp. WMMC2535]|uniref:hypothetical protein n=1 Tax=Pseudenhygromyxa sp. WMMC2535 TaxID=2712867 RepID=UPI0015544099|nr:hypothetical protein [Pseudenhygromyxa sp. WMMC2535]NVB43054.1 hypothetical protein [Pseudenhygromyxa sp. WMMC2535]
MTVGEDDLPAAHSMDTQWFVVDEAGHVAVFDSGEGGGVADAHFDWWGAQSVFEELLVELLAAAELGGVHFYSEGLFEEGHEDEGEDYMTTVIADEPGAVPVWNYAPDVVLELGEEVGHDEVARALKVEPAALWRLPSKGARLVYVAECDNEQLRAGWQAAGIRRAKVGYTPTPARMGLWVYDCETYDDGVYERVSGPRGPALRLEGLPTHLRHRLGEVCLDAVEFSRDEQVDPLEHLPGRTWGDI